MGYLCRNKGVGHRDGGTNLYEPVPQYSPDSKCAEYPREDEALLEMGNRQVGTLLLVFLPAKLPYPEAVDGHPDIIELHGTVGIQPLVVVEHNVERLHHEAYSPQPDGGLVFQQNIGQPEQGGDDVKRI